MKRFLFAGILLLLFARPVQGQLRKNHLFKVDPVSAVFKEMRVVYERRLINELWLYSAPYFYHQNWVPKSNDRWGRPDHPQKYYGLGFRLGLRQYFSGKSPMGLFINPMGGYRFTLVNQLDEGLALESRNAYHRFGAGMTVGWQNLYGTKDNIAYGFMLGLEYYVGFGKNYEADKYVQNWYEFPFSWRPDVLNGIRLYVGVELGLAFLQKKLHW